MELFNATNKVISIFNDNPLVNTITTESSSNTDMDKRNIYPLVNIELIDSQPNGVLQTFNYEIIVMQQRDVVKDLNQTKYLNNNSIDNHNECNQILMSFINTVSTSHDITISNTPTFEYIYNDAVNGVDAIRTNISVEVSSQRIC